MGKRGKEGEEGGKAGVSTTRRRRPAAYLLTFPHDFLEAKEVHSRLPRHSLTNLLFTLRFAILSELRFARALRGFILSFSLSLSFFLSFSIFVFVAHSLALFLFLTFFLSRDPISIYLSDFHACTHDT